MCIRDRLLGSSVALHTRPTAVSYTHLDVYKRQVLGVGRARASVCGALPWHGFTCLTIRSSRCHFTAAIFFGMFVLICGRAVARLNSGVRHHNMRLWSLHPKYLDPQGLVALWREALLAKAVLRGETRGYTRHPQLERFNAHPQPRSAINSYLAAIHAEATQRGYAFDRTKIGPVRNINEIAVSTGQLALEWQHLQSKLQVRNPTVLAKWNDLLTPECHPLFCSHPGPVASWERASGGA